MVTRLVVMIRRFLPGTVLVALGCLGTTGCGSSDRAKLQPVSGTVLIDGRPTADAVVTLYPVNGTSEPHPSGRSDANGRFTLTTREAGDGALAGEYRVTVTRILAVAPAGGRVVAEGESVAVRNYLPPTYARPDTTPLKATVSPGTAEPLVLEIKTKSR